MTSKSKVNDLQNISVAALSTPMGSIRKAGTIIYCEATTDSYFLTADAPANQTLTSLLAGSTPPTQI